MNSHPNGDPRLVEACDLPRNPCLDDVPPVGSLLTNGAVRRFLADEEPMPEGTHTLRLAVRDRVHKVPLRFADLDELPPPCSFQAITLQREPLHHRSIRLGFMWCRVQ